MWGKVFLNQLHTLTSNPCQFSQSLHLHYPITLLPAPQEKKKHIFFPSPRGFKRRQRHKLQEIYYCSTWQQPEKQDIYKMNSNVCRETLQVCEDSELRLHLILKKINLYQTYKQLVEKRRAIIVYVFEKLLQRFLFFAVSSHCVHKAYCTVNVWRSYRWSCQPAVLVFSTVHVPVKGIELTVAQVIHIYQVKLPPGIVVTLIVALSGEIQPLRMAKLISCNTESFIKKGT